MMHRAIPVKRTVKVRSKITPQEIHGSEFFAVAKSAEY